MAVIGNVMNYAELVYDFSVHGGAAGFINLSTSVGQDLPVGAKVVRAAYYVETAFTSGGSATVAIGDAASGARYLAATAFNDAAFADENVALLSTGLPNVVASANEGKFGITVATAALTAGKVRFVLEYWVNKN